MHGEPEDMDHQYLSAVREPTRPWQRATPPPPEAPQPDTTPDETMADPDDVVGALAQWAKDGYEWEDIESRVEELLIQPRRPAARPTTTTRREEEDESGIMRNQWAP